MNDELKEAMQAIDKVFSAALELEAIQKNLRVLVDDLNTKLDTLQQQIFERDNSEEAVDFEK
jgi:hypothetical protein